VSTCPLAYPPASSGAGAIHFAGLWPAVIPRPVVVGRRRLKQALPGPTPSVLTQWYQARFAGAGLRMRRIGIVALARRLLIALWRYLTDGVIPEGARLIASEI